MNAMCSLLLTLALLTTFDCQTAGRLITKPKDTDVKANRLAYFNCSTDIWSTAIFWYHGKKFVYTGNVILEPYQERFKVDKSEWNGTYIYNLVIHSVQPGDAGEYRCEDDEGFGEKHSIQLVVLDGDPICRSSMELDEIIGQNSCSIEPDEVELECSVRYHGNIPPRMEWERIEENITVPLKVLAVASLNQYTSTLKLRGDITLNNTSYLCATKRMTHEPNGCTLKVMKILYALSDNIIVNKTTYDEIHCSANTSQSCSYKWRWLQDNDITTESSTAVLNAKKTGLHRCDAECYLRNNTCNLLVMRAMVYGEQIYTESSQTNIIISVVVTVVVAVAAVCVLVLVYCKKQECGTTQQKTETPVIEELRPFLNTSEEVQQYIKCSLLELLPPELRQEVETILSPHYQMLSDIGAAHIPSLLEALGPELREQVESILIVRSKIQFQETDQLGAGPFAKVFRGTFTDKSGAKLPVAIKTMQGHNDIKDRVELVEEAMRMADFRHKHVLPLIAIAIDQNIPFVVLPLMELGDLRTHISKDKNSFTVGHLVNFSLQVAEGMEYLASRRVVHRDLAARNCMINNDLLVKVADFGLARNIFEKDYYREQDNQRPLPIRWMPIECLALNCEFTEKSDAWSYGVLVWELMTRGERPYRDVDNLDLRRFLLQGRRLEKPPVAPDFAYDIMLRCWLPERDDRPRFKDIVKELKEILSAAETNYDLSRTSSFSDGAVDVTVGDEKIADLPLSGNPQQ